MSDIKVIGRPRSFDPEVADLDRLRDEWTAARRQLDTDAHASTCSIPGCRTMPFVMLRTQNGRRPLCLRHFEKLREETV